MSVRIPLKCDLYVKDFPGPEPGTHHRELSAHLWVEGRDNKKLRLCGVLIAVPGEAMVVDWIHDNEVIGSDALACEALLALHDVACADAVNSISFKSMDLEPDLNESNALWKIAIALAEED